MKTPNTEKKVKLKQQNIEHFIAVTQQSESEEVKHTKKNNQRVLTFIEA